MQQSKHKSIALIIGLWSICLLISIVTFYLKWKTMRFDLLIITPLLSIISLPLSFYQLLGIVSKNTMRYSLVLFFIYWVTAGGLHYLYIKYQSWIFYILLCVLLLMSSFFWQINNIGIMYF
ncbi:hypothetical protein [Candidatus Uabimicrobium sp. HlEnr_7]|uniref:hypothetical protein n=1 Tax=Candidatus Uabimicrobium helgolandensis TaxID=3095367 RepID=UPI003556C5C7